MSTSTSPNPGCYGVPSVFSFKSTVCGACPSRDGCRGAAYQALLSVSDKTFVARFIAEHESHNARLNCPAAPRHDPSFTVDVDRPRARATFAMTDEQKAAVAELPKKAATYLMTLWKKGIPERILEAARRGQNPFGERTFRPARLAYELLVSGGFTKQGLRLAYQESLGWTEGSAFSQVSIIWRVFCALGIAMEDGCRLVPHPKLGAQNIAVN